MATSKQDNWKKTRWTN